MPKHRINGLDMFYDIGDGGQPLVLISGVSSDHTGWKLTQLPHFSAAGCRCLLFDNRDVGQTGESPLASYGTEQFASDTAELIRHLGLGPTHIVGASMGGMIAQQLALHHPDVVRSLTLVCTSARPDAYMKDVIESWKNAAANLSREAFLQDRMPWLFTHRFYEKTEIAEAYRKRVLSNPIPQPVASFQRQCDSILGHDTTALLPAIRVPTHVIVGAEDLLIPPRHSRRLAELIPNARLTIVPETGHCLFWESTVEFNRAVLDFLSGQ